MRFCKLELCCLPFCPAGCEIPATIACPIVQHRIASQRAEISEPKTDVANRVLEDQLRFANAAVGKSQEISI